MKKKIWVLTREINAYEQDGEYFVCAFEQKPSIQKLAEEMARHDCPVDLNDLFDAIAFLEHLRNGGGRRATEHTWFNLTEVDLL